MGNEARILSVPRCASPDDLTPTDVRTAIEASLGLTVAAYDGPLPPGYDWGRVYYFGYARPVALELVDSQTNVHTIVFKRGIPCLPDPILLEGQNIRLAKSFDFPPADALLQ